SLACGACASQSASAGALREGNGGSSGALSSIARIHRSRCGACHVRVEPGTRACTALQAPPAPPPHPLHLPQPEWSAMLDYLAPTDTAATKAHAMRARTTN